MGHMFGPNLAPRRSQGTSLATSWSDIFKFGCVVAMLGLVWPCRGSAGPRLAILAPKRAEIVQKQGENDPFREMWPQQVQMYRISCDRPLQNPRKITIFKIKGTAHLARHPMGRRDDRNKSVPNAWGGKDLKEDNRGPEMACPTIASFWEQRPRPKD